MKKKIWFNHWFNSAYHFINLIRNNADDQEFEFYGTNENIHSAVLQACDFSFCEPVLSNDDYIDYCLDFCKINKIDIFVPRKNMIEIAKNISLFEQLGVSVLVEKDIALLQRVNDKALFYEFCTQNAITQIPEYYIANTPDQFISAYEKLISHGHTACFKPVSGEGGSGFRVIRSSANDIEWLLNSVNHRLSVEQVMSILEKHKSFPDIMVMEYLDGLEYSIDCLSLNQKLIVSVVREKVDSRRRALVFSEEVDKLCKQIYKVFPLSYVSNIQLKNSDSGLKILEINPRMSGGLHISCHSGINFPYLAIKLLLNQKVDIQEPICNLTFTQIEKEILLRS